MGPPRSVEPQLGVCRGGGWPLTLRTGGRFQVAGGRCRGLKGLCSLGLGMAPGKRRTPGPRLARRARKTAERRTAGLQGSPASGMRLVSTTRSREWRRWSRRPRRKIGIRSRYAAHWRPVLAASVVRREASVWGSVSGPLKPSSHARSESSPYVRRQSGNFDAACRRSSVPVRTSRSVTSTLPSHTAESPDFSPPRSPAIAVTATF